MINIIKNTFTEPMISFDIPLCIFQLKKTTEVEKIICAPTAIGGNVNFCYYIV